VLGVLGVLSKLTISQSPPRLRALLVKALLMHEAARRSGPRGAGFRAFQAARESCVLMHGNAFLCTYSRRVSVSVDTGGGARK
jgi:hypothetical protein